MINTPKNQEEKIYLRINVHVIPTLALTTARRLVLHCLKVNPHDATVLLHF